MKTNRLWIAAWMICLSICFCSCGKKQNLTISRNEVVFSSAGGNAIVTVDADCDWKVNYNGEHDWYSLSRMTGSNQGVILITVQEHNSHYDRNASFSVTTSNGRVTRTVRIVQQPIAIVDIHNKVWFLHEYERWNTDYQNDYIEDSYQHWNYYIDESFDNWFFYFMDDSTGYQLHTKNGDTITYAYNYIYYPLGDSLYINFETDTTIVEDYHAVIHELNQDNFIFSDEYRPHQFEKLYMANISIHKGPIKINPKNIRKKEKGPLIQVEP